MDDMPAHISEFWFPAKARAVGVIATVYCRKTYFRSLPSKSKSNKSLSPPATLDFKTCFHGDESTESHTHDDVLLKIGLERTSSEVLRKMDLHEFLKK
jgi:hypothetical protein